MNRLLQLAVLVLLVAGCNASKPAAPAPTQAANTPNTSSIVVSDVACVGDCSGLPIPPLTDKQKIALLRAEAHKRGLKWRIFCMDWQDDPDHQFLGEAALINGAFDTRIERGSKGVWLKDGATQGDTAYALYLAIQGAQTHPAEHEKPEHEHKKFCPPELRGD